jgi:hypothetical protein
MRVRNNPVTPLAAVVAGLLGRSRWDRLPTNANRRT